MRRMQYSVEFIQKHKDLSERGFKVIYYFTKCMLLLHLKNTHSMLFRRKITVPSGKCKKHTNTRCGEIQGD